MTDVLDAVASDHRLAQVESRAAVLTAVQRVAKERGGLVHAAWVREYLPPTCSPFQVGAVITWLVRARVLVGTGQYVPNGLASSRNRTKPAEVRRLVGPLPKAIPA